ncbi:SAM-dependent methyltransferase [Vaccinium witches'-broom phytoplasma]|uniref:SAM-dependent methyltransferase n=1 Tax=Vaccinium witches'-broom phytoplasma TaxID=85642 RepID=UPI000379AE47|nr:SAM-dependent methyltransferase [Vaccinium witches'-broom phytoplasma]
MNQIIKEHFCFENFKILKNKYGIDFLINKLNVHSGTIKRWIEKKKIPFQYNFYLQKINDCLNNEQSKKQIDIFNNPLQKRKFDEFYTTEKTVDWCFETLTKELKKLDINFNEYCFIEPSAGTGNFYRKMPPNNRIGVEINPNLNKDYFISDYLDFEPKNKKNIVFGNPPFGLRGNLALRFINHSYNFADVVAFILPPCFNSDGKGSPNSRVKGYKLAYSQNLPLNSFEYPDGKKVKVSTCFQIWTKINTHLIVKTKIKTANNFIKIYSLSDGGTPGSTRNKKMLEKCHLYLPSTCFRGMKIYKSFLELPNKRGYGIKILKKHHEIKKIFMNVDWGKIAFLSTNSALNLRMSLIVKVLTDANYYDK